MKAVILVGGLGSRLKEFTKIIPEKTRGIKKRNLFLKILCVPKFNS